MEKNLASLVLFFLVSQLMAQSPWVVTADDIDPNNYYGVTVANGVVGVVSSAGLEITEEGVRQIESLIPKTWGELTISGIGKDEETFKVKK